MSGKFQDKSLRTAIVESNSSIRQIMVDVLKQAGFANSQAVSSLDDAKALLETEELDWLVIPLCLDQSLTGFHFLRYCNEFMELKGVRVSFVIEEPEKKHLSRAFEIGLFSYFSKPLTKDSFTREIQDLTARLTEFEFNEALVAAFYLDAHLKNSGNVSDLTDLYKSLLEVFPGNPHLLLAQSEALHLNNNAEASKRLLSQTLLVNPNFKDKVETLAVKLFGDKNSLKAAEGGGTNVLGLKNAIVIDSDNSECERVRQILTELGVADVKVFNDGESAWGFFDTLQEEPSFTIMEWRIPKLSGPFLSQRIRKKFSQTPIVVNSSLLKPSDMPLIREMGIANLIQKPSEKESFIKAVVWTIQQDRMPTDQTAMEIRIQGALSERNFEEAGQQLARYLEQPTFSKARKLTMRAEFELAKENYENAKGLAIDAIKLSPDSVIALNILGKTLMLMRQYPAALKCFQKAQSLSPNNIERLCHIAETEAELGQTDKAEEHLQKAKDLDPENTTVQEGQVKVALASNDQVKAKQIMSNMESIHKVISHLNNKAVANAKCGYISEGIELYNNTLAAIPDDRPDFKTRVLYNLALAKVRDNRIKEAAEDLKAVIQDENSKVKLKAMSLLNRIEVALQKNTVVTLKEADQQAISKVGEAISASQASASSTSATTNQTSNDNGIAGAVTIEALEAMVSLLPGERSCYMLFKSSETAEEPVKSILEAKLVFKRRESIERTQTIGAGSSGLAS